MAFPPGFLDELSARLSLSDVVGRKVALKRRSGSGVCRALPVPQREDAVLHGQRQEGLLLLLRLPRERRRRRLRDEDRGAVVPRVGREAGARGRPAGAARHAAGARARRAAPRPCRTSSSRRRAGSRSSCACRSAGTASTTCAAAGCRDETIDDFRLGFSPDSRDGLIGALKREGATIDKIVEAGLAIQPEDAGREPYDRFRGRVMFPINDRRGRVIAFGGRVIGPGEPKYLNSPETPLFHKGANLYCLDRARVAVDQGPAGDRGRRLHGRDRAASSRASPARWRRSARR